MVYTAYTTDGVEQIVKSTGYSEDLEKSTVGLMHFVNYVGETGLDVASYIEPGQAHSDDMKKLVTVSKLVEGVQAESVYGFPGAWVEDQHIATTIGTYMGKLRLASEQYTIDHADWYLEIPRWDMVNGGW